VRAQRSVHRAAQRLRRLPQEVADVAVHAAVALSHPRDAHRAERPGARAGAVLAELAGLGAARVSYGTLLHRAAMARFGDDLEALAARRAPRD
jgi:hypothetical protein